MNSYNVTVDSAGNIISILDINKIPIQWNDVAFQAWNAQQQPPYALSAAQTFLQTFKSLTPAQWAADQGVTAVNKDAILQGMLKTYSIGVI